MRTTLEIIIAVQECQPATEEELRLALVALSGIESFISHDLQDLVDDVIGGKPTAKFRAEYANGTIDRMFQARKTPPDKWLGPNGIPGTPENIAGRAISKRIFKAATGIDL